MCVEEMLVGWTPVIDTLCDSGNCRRKTDEPECQQVPAPRFLALIVNERFCQNRGGYDSQIPQAFGLIPPFGGTSV